MIYVHAVRAKSIKSVAVQMNNIKGYKDLSRTKNSKNSQNVAILLSNEKKSFETIENTRFYYGYNLATRQT